MFFLHHPVDGHSDGSGGSHNSNRRSSKKNFLAFHRGGPVLAAQMHEVLACDQRQTF